MANRSDFNSILPRKTKRMLALMAISLGMTKAEHRDQIRSFISAHESHRAAVKRRQTQKGNVDIDVTEVVPEL